MAAPVIDSATTDKNIYVTGDKITLTVVYHDPDSHVDLVTITPQSPDGTVKGVTVTIDVPVSDPVALALTSAIGKVYVKASDDGRTAVFSSVA